MATKDFIAIADFSAAQLQRLLARAVADKKLFRSGELPPSCVGKTLGLIFQKPSLRTRVSFEAAIVHLGGAAIYLAEEHIGLGKREAVGDVAAVLGRMCDGIAARTFEHRTVVELAQSTAAPVINALSDYSHPCQAMADIMTMMEVFGEVAGRKLAFIGDGNNVARSLAALCGKLGIGFVLACPKGYELEEQFVTSLESPPPEQTHDARSAANGADVIYTDTWVSMGQEQQRPQRLAEFEGFQVNEQLLAAAPDHAVVMHCLPAYRGCEISEGIMTDHAETIFTQAENRLHFQRTLLNALIAEGGVA